MECFNAEIPADGVVNSIETEEISENVVKADETTLANGEDEAGKAGEEYAYLERNEFTSEIFKVEVKNMGYFGIGVGS